MPPKRPQNVRDRQSIQNAKFKKIALSLKLKVFVYVVATIISATLKRIPVVFNRSKILHATLSVCPVVIAGTLNLSKVTKRSI